MKRAMLLPIFLLGLSCSIHASHTPHTQHRPYPDRGPYRRANPAYELETATGALRQDAEYAFRGRGRYERKALKEIRKLHQRARNYRRTVERRRGDERRSRRDFDKLMRQYYRAESALRYSRAPRQVYRSFNHLRRLMSRLQGGYRYYRYRY